jgi:hypothetical protein
MPWLVPGQTTREEVVLHLGEPDEIENDGAKLVYLWGKIYLQVWIVVFIPPNYANGDGREYGRNYALELTFNRRGLLINQVLQEISPRGTNELALTSALPSWIGAATPDASGPWPMGTSLRKAPTLPRRECVRYLPRS